MLLGCRIENGSNQRKKREAIAEADKNGSQGNNSAKIYRQHTIAIYKKEPTSRDFPIDWNNRGKKIYNRAT